MSTGAAVTTYNILLAEGRRVAAGLIAVDHVEMSAAAAPTASSWCGRPTKTVSCCPVCAGCGATASPGALCLQHRDRARYARRSASHGLVEISCRWWRDAVGGAVSRRDARHHPVAQALAGVSKPAPLPIPPIIALIESRQFDLYDDPMPTIGRSRRVSRRDLIGPDPDGGADCWLGCRGSAEAAGLAGVAYGLTGVLRALPIHRARGQCFVPEGYPFPSWVDPGASHFRARQRGDHAGVGMSFATWPPDASSRRAP